jgi:hypothetical protein
VPIPGKIVTFSIPQSPPGSLESLLKEVQGTERAIPLDFYSLKSGEQELTLFVTIHSFHQSDSGLKQYGARVANENPALPVGALVTIRIDTLDQATASIKMEDPA